MAKTPVKGQTGQRNGQRLPHVLTEAEVAALLARVNTRCPTGLRNRAALAAMLGAGLRVSELCALRGVDVDLARGTVRVNLGKGGKDRVIPVDQETRGWLQAWAERRAGLQLNGQGAFFPGLRIGRTGAGVRKRGEALRPRYWQGLLTRLAEAAEIEGKRVSPHVLRHTYATRRLDRGFSIREAQVPVERWRKQFNTVRPRRAPRAIARRRRRRWPRGQRREEMSSLRRHKPPRFQPAKC